MLCLLNFSLKNIKLQSHNELTLINTQDYLNQIKL